MTALIRVHLFSIAKGQHYLSSPTFIISPDLQLPPGLFLKHELIPYYVSRLQSQNLFAVLSICE